MKDAMTDSELMKLAERCSTPIHMIVSGTPFTMRMAEIINVHGVIVGG